MSAQPSISVVVATYKRPDLIGSCLDALGSQTLPPLEVIVVDQSPDTRTREVVASRSIHAPIRYLHSDVAGVSLARNTGFRAAQGAVVAITDDDALPEPAWLEALLRAFAASSPRPGLVGGRILPLWEGERPPWFPAAREYLLPIFDLEGELRPFPEGSLPMTVNVAIDRSVFERLGGFDESVGPQTGWKISGEDSLFAWRALEAGVPIWYQPDAVVRHRVPKERMRRGFLLERSFNEGTSLMHIEEKRGLLTRERLRAHVSWHRRHVLRKILSLVKYPTLSPWNDPRVFEALSYAWTSRGVVTACRDRLRNA